MLAEHGEEPPMLFQPFQQHLLAFADREARVPAGYGGRHRGAPCGASRRRREPRDHNRGAFVDPLLEVLEMIQENELIDVLVARGGTGEKGTERAGREGPLSTIGKECSSAPSSSRPPARRTCCQGPGDQLRLAHRRARDTERPVPGAPRVHPLAAARLSPRPLPRRLQPAGAAVRPPAHARRRPERLDGRGDDVPELADLVSYQGPLLGARYPLPASPALNSWSTSRPASTSRHETSSPLDSSETASPFDPFADLRRKAPWGR